MTEIVSPGDGHLLTARGNVMAFKAVAAQTGGDFSLMERTVPAAGTARAGQGCLFRGTAPALGVCFRTAVGGGGTGADEPVWDGSGLAGLESRMVGWYGAFRF